MGCNDVVQELAAQQGQRAATASLRLRDLLCSIAAAVHVHLCQVMHQVRKVCGVIREAQLVISLRLFLLTSTTNSKSTISKELPHSASFLDIHLTREI